MFALETGGGPVHLQLKKQILELMGLEVLHPGDVLPTVRVMAREMGISPRTVARAYRELEQEGVVFRSGEENAAPEKDAHSGTGEKQVVLCSSEAAKEAVQGQCIYRLEQQLRAARSCGVAYNRIVCLVRRIFEQDVSAVLGKGEEAPHD